MYFLCLCFKQYCMCKHFLFSKITCFCQRLFFVNLLLYWFYFWKTCICRGWMSSKKFVKSSFYRILLSSKSSKSWKLCKIAKQVEKSCYFWDTQIPSRIFKKSELKFWFFVKTKKLYFWDLRRTEVCNKRQKHVFSNVF